MSKTPAPRLGRGLDAIFGTKQVTPPAPAPNTGTTPPAGGLMVREVAIDTIVPNPNQPRREFDTAALEELAASIRVRGVLQPIIVRERGDGAYELVAGERRWRAAKLAAKATIPAIARTMSEGDSVEIALIENIQRADLNPMERAVAYQAYLDTFGVTSEQLSVRLGESRASVSNHVRLLRLPPEVRELVQRGELSMGHARALLSVEDSQRILGLARLATRRGLSVRQVEAFAKSAVDETSHAAPQRTASRHFADLDREFSKALGVAVRIRPGKKKNSGKIVIAFSTLDEFDRISGRLGIADSANG